MVICISFADRAHGGRTTFSATAFSTTTLQNCAQSKLDDSPVPLTLNASLSFPSSNYHGRPPRRQILKVSEDFPPHPTTWAAHPVPSDDHLVLTLDLKLGEGRIGAVYTVTPTSATYAAFPL